MLFSSFSFLIFFLPLLILVYLPKNLLWRNSILLIFSLLFYAWGGVSMTAILVLSILLNHFFARKIQQKKKPWLNIGILVNVLILINFKYLDFFIQNINVLLGFISEVKPLNLLHIKLPLGISFFTFQGMSMLWDIAKQEKKEKLHLHETALYIAFFPQLIAGPIIRYHDIIAQIRARKSTWDGINEGSKRFVIGLFKKVALANPLGFLANQIFETDLQLNDSSSILLAVIAYSLQIFFDFSGYSDMAIGLGKMLGFHIPENFNFPYVAKSIQDFWRRWHISLSTWFRDYVYIALGGNRAGNWKTYRNLILVFLLTGFWHGATWSFVFWGAFHGFFILLERLFLGKTLTKLPAFLQHFYTLAVVGIGWIFFRIENFSEALEITKHLFSGKGDNGWVFIQFLNNENLVILFLGLWMCVPHKKINLLSLSNSRNILFRFISQLSYPILVLYCLVLLSGSTFNPFIYFRF